MKVAMDAFSPVACYDCKHQQLFREVTGKCGRYCHAFRQDMTREYYYRYCQFFEDKNVLEEEVE